MGGQRVKGHPFVFWSIIILLTSIILVLIALKAPIIVDEMSPSAPPYRHFDIKPSYTANTSWPIKINNDGGRGVSLIETNNGTALMAYGWGEINLVSSSDGRNWSLPVELTNMETSSIWPLYPILIQLDGGEYVIIFEINHDFPGLYMLRSNDGLNWSAPVKIINNTNNQATHDYSMFQNNDGNVVVSYADRKNGRTLFYDSDDLVQWRFFSQPPIALWDIYQKKDGSYVALGFEDGYYIYKSSDLIGWKKNGTEIKVEYIPKFLLTNDEDYLVLAMRYNSGGDVFFPPDVLLTFSEDGKNWSKFVEIIKNVESHVAIELVQTDGGELIMIFERDSLQLITFRMDNLVIDYSK